MYATLSTWIARIPVLRGFVPERPLRPLQDFRPPEADGAIIVLVHGTWGRKSDWLKAGSKLQTAIAKELPSTGVCVFRWSGTNGLLHRLTASEHLATLCTELHKAHTGSKILLLTHSHGGNVAAWAATQISFEIEAALYVNTPFLQLLNDRNQSTFFLRVFLFIAVMSVIGAFFSYIDSSDWFGLLFPMLATGLWLTQRYVPPRVRAIRDKLALYSSGARRIVSESVIAVVGDEPAAAFGFVDFARVLGLNLIRAGAVLLSPLMFGLWLAHFLPSPLQNKLSDVYAYTAFVGICVVFAATACVHGLTQALVSLDSPVTLVPGPPLRPVELVTIVGSEKEAFRHSMESDEVTQEVMRKLTNIVHRA